SLVPGSNPGGPLGNNPPPEKPLRPSLGGWRASLCPTSVSTAPGALSSRQRPTSCSPPGRLPAIGSGRPTGSRETTAEYYRRVTLEQELRELMEETAAADQDLAARLADAVRYDPDADVDGVSKGVLTTVDLLRIRGRLDGLREAVL